MTPFSKKTSEYLAPSVFSTKILRTEQVFSALQKDSPKTFQFNFIQFKNETTHA